MQNNTQESWEEWKDNFCQHISDWSYFSADEELEKMKNSLLSKQAEEISEAVEKNKLLEAEFPGSVFTIKWKQGYNKALSDTLLAIKQVINK